MSDDERNEFHAANEKVIQEASFSPSDYDIDLPRRPTATE